MSDFRAKLAAAVQQEHKLMFYAPGSVHPPYNRLSVTDSLTKFCADILPLSPIQAPRGKRIKIIKTNFPKLAGLEHKTLSRDELRASDIIQAIENGSFNLEDYNPDRDDRLRTLFWLPELLSDPDAIYRNAHKIVAGSEIYVRVYNKSGSRIKLAFTMDILNRKQKLVSTVVITSFLTDAATALTYVEGEPLYRRPKTPENKKEPS